MLWCSLNASHSDARLSGLATTSWVRIMPDGLLFLLTIIALVVAYTIVRVRQYQRLSEKQWRDVDKSKLKEWEDDDDW